MGDTVMPTLTQDTLFGERDAQYGEIDIQNSKLYPFVRTINSVGDEARLQVGPDGFHTDVLNAANVMAVYTDLSHEDALSETVTVGPVIDDLHGILSNQPRDANVTLEIAEPFGALTVERDEWTVSDRVPYIDVMSVREEPDLPELELPVQIDVDVSTVASYLTDRNTTDVIEMRTEDGQLHIGQRADQTDYRAVASRSVDTGESVTSIFDYGYLKTAFTTLRSVSAETATVHLGDEFPIKIEFEVGELSGTYLIAPRIQST